MVRRIGEYIPFRVGSSHPAADQLSRRLDPTAWSFDLVWMLIIPDSACGLLFYDEDQHHHNRNQNNEHGRDPERSMETDRTGNRAIGLDPQSTDQL